MILAGEDEMICDFAETYNIYDYRRLPLRTAAIFASGLRDTSRIKMKMAGMDIDAKTAILAAIADRTGTLVWMQSKDGAKNRNRPESILSRMLSGSQEKETVMAFESGKAFEETRNRILEGRK